MKHRPARRVRSGSGHQRSGNAGAIALDRDQIFSADVFSQNEIEDIASNPAAPLDRRTSCRWSGLGRGRQNIEDATYHLAVEAHTNARGKPINDETRTMYTQKGGHLGRLLRVCGGCAAEDVDGSLTEACEAKHTSIELTKLKRHDVVRYIDQRISEGAARTTIRKDLNTLSVALKLAADRGWCSHSLAAECIPPFAAESTPRTRWLTSEEFPKLLAALDTTEQLAKPHADPIKESKRLAALEAPESRRRSERLASRPRS